MAEWEADQLAMPLDAGLDKVVDEEQIYSNLLDGDPKTDTSRATPLVDLQEQRKKQHVKRQVPNNDH